MAIQYFLTDVGRDIALNATSLGLNVSLSHIGVGTAKYDPLTELDRTALVAEVERYPLNGGGVEPNSHTLRFVTSIEPTITVDGFEIGIFTDTGTLFAIASTTGNDPLIRLVANIVAISSFGMILSTLDLTNLIITVDPNTPICVALMNQHLDHPNPHPQYSKKIDTDAALLALKVTTITAGAGLTGGGDLSENRTVMLGTPSTITSGSGNEASGSTHTHELGDGSVTDAKIANVSASKITGVIAAENLPPASASINVIDNLNSSSVNDALSANQGRVLAEQLVDKLSIDGGTVTGNLNVDGDATIANLIAIAINSPSLISTLTNTIIQTLFGKLTIATVPDDNRLFLQTDKSTFEFNKNIRIWQSEYDALGHLEIRVDDDIDGPVTLDTNCGYFDFGNKGVYFGSVQKAANGYTTLPNGLIMQWGRGNISNGNNDVQFPIAFPSTLLGVQVTDEGAGSISHGYDMSVSTTTSFRCTSQGGGGLAYSYIALGY